MSDLASSSSPRRPRYRFVGCGARFRQRAATVLWVLALVLPVPLVAAVPFAVEVGWVHAVALSASVAATVLAVADMQGRTR